MDKYINDAEFIRMYPALRNRRLLEIFKHARAKRIELGKSAEMPLFSHNATYQSIFSKGWKSITPGEEIRDMQEVNPNGAVARLMSRFGGRVYVAK
jgi:hypothetical protein